jgi:hypothetical protein
VTAVFSKESPPLYRLRLDRQLSMFGGPVIASLLHNPSIAGHENDDPTSKRTIGFANAAGASRLVMINMWAGIATWPPDLWKMDDPFGPENALYLEQVARGQRQRRLYHRRLGRCIADRGVARLCSRDSPPRA